MINVTKPFSPPFEEVEKYLKEVWQRNWFTNNGPLVNELELKLKDYLGVNHLLYVTNGTIALQLAIKALGLKGEIITTPFSYIATASSILWESCTPKFADIDPNTLNIDPETIEPLVSSSTSAILATHVFGNPCDVNSITNIANKHGLRVIYDGAHAFGTIYGWRSLLEYGDITTASFHATKLYHTVEGGAVITKDPSILRQLSFMRNFGHNGPEEFECVGINGKNSEVHAAVGLVNLRYIEEVLRKRKELVEYYKEKIRPLRVKTLKISPDTKWNHSYFPVIFESESQLLKSVKELNNNWIYPRRYFYPSLSTLGFLNKSSSPVSEDIAKRILCLPLYHELKLEEIDFVTRLLLRAQKY